MDILILNTQLESSSLLDTYESLVWTDRYYKYGDFEVYTPVSIQLISEIQPGYYLWSRDSEHTMIVEGREIVSDAEAGNKLIVTGRSLESILCRRIVWNMTTLTGSLQNGIKQLLDDAIINPTDPNRKIDNFIFVESTDPAITELTLETQIEQGKGLYDTIVSICESVSIGFKVILTDDGQFAFSLYAGTDRSYDQLANPYVVFSPKFENIINSNYLESDKNFKNVTLVAGEGEDNNRVTLEVTTEAGVETGLNRRELFTDVRYLSKKTSDRTLTDAEYQAELKQKGLEELAEYTAVKTFEGEVDTVNMFVYGEDFFMGDIVQVANEYGAASKSRVTEFIHSQDQSGKKAYPTFVIVE